MYSNNIRCIQKVTYISNFLLLSTHVMCHNLNFLLRRVIYAIYSRMGSKITDKCRTKTGYLKFVQRFFPGKEFMTKNLHPEFYHHFQVDDDFLTAFLGIQRQYLQNTGKVILIKYLITLISLIYLLYCYITMSSYIDGG